MRKAFAVGGGGLALVVLAMAGLWSHGVLGVGREVQAEAGHRWSSYRLTDVDAKRKAAGHGFEEFLRVPDLSAGLYVLEMDGVDRQKPHTEDEIYYIVSGKGFLRMDDHDEPVSAGSVIYVQAKVPHHFHSIEEELKILVVFAPAFGTRAAEK